MSQGQGSISLQPRREPAAAAGVTGAFNGLSLSGTDVILGGPMTIDTIIDLATFNLTFSDPFFNFLQLDANSGQIFIGDGTSQIHLFSGGSEIQIGDYSSGGVVMIVDNSVPVFKVSTNNGMQNYFEILPSSGLYSIGDLSTTGNGSGFLIADANQQFAMEVNTERLFFIDKMNGIYQLGDIIGSNNGNQLAIDDVARTSSLGDVNSIFGGTSIIVDDTLFRVTLNGGVYINGGSTLLHSLAPLSNSAGAAVGTLNNAPTAGNPTKWITIDDFGTNRKIPTWL